MAQNTIFYSNQQTGAPQITNTAGGTLALLDACLVNGFNSKTISTLSVTSNVATATFSTDHGYQLWDVIAISGANESQFNSNWMVKTVPDTTTLTFDITTADVTATGTITCKTAPLGWEIAYTGTNLRAYRSPIGNRRYLRIDDTNTNYSLVQMYKTMSAISTGTSVGSQSYWNRYTPYTSVNMNWLLVGNQKMFYFMPAPTPYYYATFYAFGDYLSPKAADTKNTILISWLSQTSSTPPSEDELFEVNVTTSLGYPHTIYESIFSQQPGLAIKMSNWLVLNLGNANNATGPNTYAGGFDFDSIFLFEVYSSQFYFIGTLPGLLTPLQCSNGILPNGYKFTAANGVKCIIAKLSTYYGPGNIAFTLNDWV